MIIDQRDLLLLRLAGAYRYVPVENLNACGFRELQAGFEILTATGLINLARNGKYFQLKPAGYKFLDSLGFHYEPSAKRAYANSPALRRRLEVSSVMLTCLRAGIDTLQDNVNALARQPTFYPAFALRVGGINLMNAASCIGFGNWGNHAYMFQYVGADSRGMYQSNEMTQFKNLSSVFSDAIRYPKAVIFAGESYTEVYDRVHRRIVTHSKSSRGYVDYSEVYADLEIPIHLLACNETGATQLAVMCQADYNTRIAHAAFAERISPDMEIPEADGRVDDFTFIVGVDMDTRRIMRIIETARKLGRNEVVIAALPKQMQDFYTPLFAADNFVTIRSIPDNVIIGAFDNNMRLYEPDKSSPARTKTGGAINA